MAAERAEQHLLQEHNYNSVGNLVRFYKEYRSSGHTDLAQFLKTYQPLITSEHHTCVGLGLLLLRRLRDLEDRFPGIDTAVHLVSVEEQMEDIEEVVTHDPDPDTCLLEHVMVAVRLNVSGRCGLLLLDPGYHVSRAVTVMEDQLYPHTGWFTQSKEDHCTKYYNYKFSADRRYVVWRAREKRTGQPDNTTNNAVFIALPFPAVLAVNIIEKRNLVYNFRSLLSRDTKGSLTAGVYFPVRLGQQQPQLTMFCRSLGRKLQQKMNFSDFIHQKNLLNEDQLSLLEQCSQLLGLQPDQLFDTLHTVANLLSDSNFVSQLLDIDKALNDMADGVLSCV